MNSRILIVASLTTGLTALACLAGACSGGGESGRSPGEATGQAIAAITTVPPMVGCIEIDVTGGSRSVTSRTDVMQGKTAVISLTGLPLGSDTFVGLAYPSACAGVMSTTQATWISDPVKATLSAQAVASVSLTLHPDGQASVGVGFAPDDAGLTCAAPLVACAGTCVNPTSDPNNCGACGFVCPSGSMCSNAACTTSCPAGTTQCAGGCVNLTSDNNNCGTCGNACPAGNTCTAGVCVAAKAAAGAACSANAQCASGLCGPGGSTGTHCCASTCSASTAACGPTDCNATGACVYPGSTTAPASLQTPGDCRKVECNGSGGTTSADDPTDLPSFPSACLINPSCCGPSPLTPCFTQAPTGTACTSASDPNASVCGTPNGSLGGTCVECNTNGDCLKVNDAGTLACNVTTGTCQ